MCQLGLVQSATAPLARARGDHSPLYQDPRPLTVCFAAVIGRVLSRIPAFYGQQKQRGSVMENPGQKVSLELRKLQGQQCREVEVSLRCPDLFIAQHQIL